MLRVEWGKIARRVSIANIFDPSKLRLVTVSDSEKYHSAALSEVFVAGGTNSIEPMSQQHSVSITLMYLLSQTIS